MEVKSVLCLTDRFCKLRELKYILFIVVLALNAGLSYSQSSGSFFGNQYINGDIKLQGSYRVQQSVIGDMREDQRSTYYIGGVRINTGSYLWNPDIIFINLDGEYNPETRRETYLLVPDRSEVRTLKKIDFRTTIFRNKPVTFNTFVNLNQTYYNRELLTNIRSDNRQLGGLFSLNNKILPASISYRQSDWTQNELQTGRTFSMVQKNIIGRISKSFGTYDRHEILVSRDDYNYNYAGSKEVNNLIDKVSLNNSIYFDKGRKYNYISQISYYNQAGDNEFTKMEAIERLMFMLPAKLRLTGGYNYYNMKDPFQTLNQNRIYGSLNHQLFESLTSNISIDYSEISHTVYDEKNLKAGLDVSYSKKIPTGMLNFSYRYFRSYFDMTGVSAPVKTINEEHVLSDGKIVFLDKPYVDLSTLLIKDQAGVIIYQLNFDYTITVRNNFIEIQRVPGGLIANDQAITADYTSIQPGSYNYVADNNSFSTGILLFKRLIELYYRNSVQDYSKLTETDFLTLNYYNQNVYGGRIDVGFAGFGVEYDEYNSNIIPYRRYRYFIDLNWSFRSKLLLAVNGNILDYKLIDDDVNQMHSNINGKLTYIINQKTKIDLDAGYLSQKGRNIDLEMITSKLEISTSFRQLFFKGGFEMYRRHYLKSDFTFAGTFVEIVRKF
jgi:hypothetical protein